MNYCRFGVQNCPVRTRKSIARATRPRLARPPGDERVQVSHKRLKHLTHAVVRRTGRRGEHLRREILHALFLVQISWRSRAWLSAASASN